MQGKNLLNFRHKDIFFVVLNVVLVICTIFLIYQFIPQSKVRYTIQNEIPSYTFSITNKRVLAREIAEIFPPPWDFYNKRTIDQIIIKIVEGEGYDASQPYSQLTGRTAVLTVPLFTARLPEQTTERNAYISRVVLNNFYILSMDRIEFDPNSTSPVILPIENRQALVSLNNLNLQRKEISFISSKQN